MSKAGSNVVGNLIVLVAVAIGIFLLLKYFSSKQNSAQKPGGGLLGGGGGAGGGIALPSAGSLKTLLTGIVDFWKGQIAAFNLPTYSPTSSATISTSPLASLNMSGWGFSPSSFGSGSSSLSDILSLNNSALDASLNNTYIDTQPLQTLDMSGWGFSPTGS
jgi:hypothetical protein